MSDKNKVILIGLDGGTFDIMMPFIENGSMPVVKSLIDEGVHGILKSTFPPLTCPAWFSFSTGRAGSRDDIARAATPDPTP